jgi:hypothetical protein
MTVTSETAPTAEPIPEAATRRLEDGIFTSSLTIGELAALDHLALEPVDVVQGFSVMHLRFMTSMGMQYQSFGSGWSESYQCPHGYIMSNEHRTWGANFEQAQYEDGWAQGFELAHDRLLDEAKEVGADGVIGVINNVGQREGIDALEFHLYGTAVRFREHGTAAPTPFTTSLAGPRLVKLLQAGLAPVRVLATLAELHVIAVCTTQYLCRGGMTLNYAMPPASGSEIVQWSNALTEVRRLARQRLRSQLGTDELRDVTMTCYQHLSEEGDGELTCALMGNRVRRVAPFPPQEPPTPILRLS